MTKQTSRKFRPDLTPAQREQAERIGSLPAGQRIKTAWGMRVEHFTLGRRYGDAPAASSRERKAAPQAAVTTCRA